MKVNEPRKHQIRQAELLAVRKACKAVFCPTPGFKRPQSFDSSGSYISATTYADTDRQTDKQTDRHRVHTSQSIARNVSR